MEGWQTQVVAAPTVEVAARLQLTVLLPAYNEAEAIGSVLAEIVEALSACTHPAPRDEKWPTCSASHRQLAERVAHTWEYEILVVDDASTDRTAEGRRGLCR